jgi:pimeloyl-ACP methyl ester carboxylesterase
MRPRMLPSSKHSSRRTRMLSGLSVTLLGATLLACETESTLSLDPVADRDAAVDAATDAPASDLVGTGELAPAIVQVSGRDIEIVEGGAGGATVIFEAGLGSDWSAWEAVASQVATRARVFAYSRPGYGRSDASAAARDATHIVADLRALLAARHLAPPYVLVGHSFGGAYMELFAKTYPSEVAALVLVDPRHRDFAVACETSGLEGCTIPASVVASLPDVQRREVEAFASASDEIAAAGSFGGYPVRVLTATSHGFAPEVEALWGSMLKSLADEADDGRQLVFPGAGHLLQLERPHEVAEAIQTLLPAASN